MVRVGMTPQPKPHARCAPRREEHRCRSSGGRATTAQAYSPLATGACLSVWWAGVIQPFAVSSAAAGRAPAGVVVNIW